MTKMEIIKCIRAQINAANQNNIVLKDCVFIIGDNVYETLFEVEASIYTRVIDFTISGVTCWVTSIYPDKCELYIPLEVRNVKRSTN